MDSTVLVTGGSGFIAGHCIVQLLRAGSTVRTTVRSSARERELRVMLKNMGVPPGARLTCTVAVLESDAGWSDAASGCAYVLHIASPFPPGLPKHEDELIVPAREGSLRVLRAARDGGVKRVVLTSSFAAIGYGHPPQTVPFDETSWTDPRHREVTPYAKSKTEAERAAWSFLTREGGSLELSVINPVGVFGPVLAPGYSTSIRVVQRMMDGSMVGCPRVRFGVVDVRDVADLHLRALTHPAAKGERFIASAGDFLSMLDIANILRRRLGARASRVPARELPNWWVRIRALFDPAARQVLPALGKTKNATNQKAKLLLGWAPRSSEESLVATAESLLLLEHGGSLSSR